MLKPRKLKTVSIAINAPVELTYQVVASAGRLVEDQGDVKIVDFETQLGDKKLVTRERIRLDPLVESSTSGLGALFPTWSRRSRFCPTARTLG